MIVGIIYFKCFGEQLHVLGFTHGQRIVWFVVYFGMVLLGFGCEQSMSQLILIKVEMSFRRVPEEFMKGKFMAPHSFSDPQNPSHGQYVNLQLRNDLYFSTLQDISNIQFRWLSLFKKDEWVKLERISECQNQQFSWFQQLSDEYKKSKGRTLKENQNIKVELLSCQQWQVAYHYADKTYSSNYRVHILQSSTDIFKSQIFAPTLLKTLKDFIVN